MMTELVVSIVILALLVVGGLTAYVEYRYRKWRRDLIGQEARISIAGDRSSPLEVLLSGSDIGEEPGREGDSGHLLLPDGPEAFGMRLQLARTAVRSLDLQYYTWHDDLAGMVLAREMMAAAERGVRVRILIDDLGASSRLLSALAAHPLITVRVFNPSVTRFAYYANWLFSFRRLNRRMHNKAFVADAVAAIVGGRNIGDRYFGFADRTNYRDIDVLAAGPSAALIKVSFDSYWHNEHAMPAEAFGYDKAAEVETLAQVVNRLETSIDSSLDGRGSHWREAARNAARNLPDLRAIAKRLDWAPSFVLYDPPTKVAGGGLRLGGRINAMLASAQKTLDIEAGYFIPGRRGINRMRRLRTRDVGIRILTNSLATNDVFAAQAAYARYRKPLLRAGVELFELKVDAPISRIASLFEREEGAGLHTKVFLLDNFRAIIGSYNLDPRSAFSNTEIVLVVDCIEFAGKVAVLLEQGRSAENSYRLELRGQRPGDRPVWIDDGKVLGGQPNATRPARLVSWMAQRLPLERLT